MEMRFVATSRSHIECFGALGGAGGSGGTSTAGTSLPSWGPRSSCRVKSLGPDHAGRGGGDTGWESGATMIGCPGARDSGGASGVAGGAASPERLGLSGGGAGSWSACWCGFGIRSPTTRRGGTLGGDAGRGGSGAGAARSPARNNAVKALGTSSGGASGWVAGGWGRSGGRKSSVNPPAPRGRGWASAGLAVGPVALAARPLSQPSNV